MIMTRLELIYITLICMLLSLAGCESSDENDSRLNTNQQPAPIVYLSVTKAQAAGLETFNDDATDFEDRVHDLAMLVFDSSTGEKICEYFDEGIPFSEKDKSFVVKLTPGQRDFFFVANMPMQALKTIGSRADMEIYMNTLNDMDESLYLSANETKGFAMSRVYKNQTISDGGNIYTSQPFRPVNENNVEEDRVKLIRVVAKLEIQIDGAIGSLGVKNIYYHNANRQYSLNSLTAPLSMTYYDDKPLKKTNNIYTYYMPESLMSAPTWSTTTDNKPINYFVIETLNGNFYKIPIITYDGSIAADNYMAFATGKQTAKPDYNIYRNRHYVFIIKKLQTIEILYSIDPWEVKENATYMGYGYNVNIDDNGKVSISNTIEACAPHAVILKTLQSYTFSDGTTQKSFSSLDTTASEEYALNSVPPTGSGAYLEVYYNDNLVKTFTK